MSGYWHDEEQPPTPLTEPPASPAPNAFLTYLAPDVSLPGPEHPSSAPGDGGSTPPRSFRKRAMAVAAVMSVVVAFGVIATVTSKVSGVRAALASVFASPTLKVVMSAHTANPQEQTTVSQYSVALTVTSQNGRQPLSGSDGVDDYEVSVLRGSTDLADLIIADDAVFVRVNVRAVDPGSYAHEMQSLASDLRPGPAYDVARAFLGDEWVGVEDSTVESFAKSLGATTPQPQSRLSFDNLRNAFTLSFAQSWDTWASVHQLSSRNGVTEYSLKLPVQHFVATFFKDIKGTLLEDVPSADEATFRSELNLLSALIGRIPAGLEIPMTLWVTNGSLSRLDIAYNGDSLDLAISHPAVGVAPPAGASMLTASVIRSLVNAYLPCGPLSGSTNASGASGLASSSCGPGTSGAPGNVTMPGGVPGGSSGVPAISGISSGLSGISSLSGISGSSGGARWSAGSST